MGDCSNWCMGTGVGRAHSNVHSNLGIVTGFFFTLQPKHWNTRYRVCDMGELTHALALTGEMHDAMETLDTHTHIYVCMHVRVSVCAVCLPVQPRPVLGVNWGRRLGSCCGRCRLSRHEARQGGAQGGNCTHTATLANECKAMATTEANCSQFSGERRPSHVLVRILRQAVVRRAAYVGTEAATKNPRYNRIHRVSPWTPAASRCVRLKQTPALIRRVHSAIVCAFTS